MGEVQDVLTNQYEGAEWEFYKRACKKYGEDSKDIAELLHGDAAAGGSSKKHTRRHRRGKEDGESRKDRKRSKEAEDDADEAAAEEGRKSPNGWEPKAKSATKKAVLKRRTEAEEPAGDDDAV